MKNGRRAQRAPKNWRPPESFDETALTYRATLETTQDSYTIDASRWGAPQTLTLELLRAMQKLVENEGAWRRRDTVQKNAGMVRGFAQWVGRWDDPNVAKLTQPSSISEITPAIWSAYMLSVTKPDTQTHKRILLQVAQVLTASGLLTENAASRVEAPKGKPEHGEVEFYTDDEFRAIVSAAKRVVRLAHARIVPNYEAALSSDGQETVATRESVLRQMLVTTIPLNKPDARLVGAFKVLENWSTERQRVVTSTKIQKQDARRLLFPDQSEGFAAMVLLACMRGLNLSQVESLKIPDRSVDSAHEFAEVKTDKPRRGARRRFSMEVFGDDADDSDGRWLRRIEEMTEPLREHAMLIGEPTEALVGYFKATGTLTFTPSSSIERGRMEWQRDLPTVDFRRIKRTFETRHRRESSQNSEAMHIVGYLLRDPERVAEFQDKAAAGIARAHEHAIAQVELRVFSEDTLDVDVAEDSAFAACIDPDHEPRTGLPCRDGFLGCLSCPNAIATPRHLPLMQFTLGLLDEMRGVLPDALWASRFADAYAQLSYVLATAPKTSTERRVTKEQQALIRAAIGLTGGPV